MGSAQTTLKSAETIFLSLLTIGLIGLLFLIIYGNLSGNLGFTDVSTDVVNETIAVSGGDGVYTINDATNVNFVSWNATLILNATFGVGGGGSDETLVEGVDYTINTANGTFFNLTGANLNQTNVTYTVVREAQGETDTDNVIGNLTTGATQFFTFSNVWFILTAVTVLIGIVLGVIILVKQVGMTGRKKGDSRFAT